MPDVLDAYAAYKRADQDALLMRFRARARLGLAVKRERARGATERAIAEKLGVVTNQIGRYQQAYRDWLRDHPGEDLEDDGERLDVAS